MYHQYFGLDEAPFSIAVNPRYLFMSPRHRDALAHLLYGVGTGGGFILLTGEVGTGKTTINRCLLEQLPHDTDIAIILNPALNAMELLATACDELGIAYDAERHTLKSLTDSLHKFLLDNHGRGRKTVLMIDEAQHLDFDVLEQIRLLTNLETNSEKLLQIILIGQPELAQMLGRPELRQLNQRITARYDLGPLTRDETGAYIRHRLQVAGMTSGRELFPPRVVAGIHRQTRGIPRLINVLCDRMLLGAYGRNKTRVDMSMLRQAATEVMGQAAEQRGSSTRTVFLVIALILVLGAAGGWLWRQGAGTGAVVAGAPASGAGHPALPGDPARLPQSGVSPSSSQLAAAAQAAGPVDVAAGETTVAGEIRDGAVTAADPGSWLLSPAVAEGLLWKLLSGERQPGVFCTSQVQAGLACVKGTAQTWGELAVIDRPVLLELITRERFAAAALLLDIEGRSAWLGTPSGAIRVELAELAALWSGGYRFLWHPPANFERPVWLGEESPAVAAVAGLFARLDGQARPLSGTRFNSALQQRVRLFQRQHDLLDDGVVGMQTLLKLNEALGIDQTAVQARATMGQAGVAR